MAGVKGLIFSVFLAANALAAAGLRFQKIEIMTSDCGDCGMAGLFGGLYAKVCFNNGQSCCQTDWLDSAFENNFQAGEIDVFTHEDTLGECFDFDFGTNPIASKEGMITLFHDGTDGFKGDWAKVYTLESNNQQGNTYQCNFDSFLDGNESEAGKGCGIIN